MLVRALVEADRAWAAALVVEYFGATVVVSGACSTTLDPCPD